MCLNCRHAATESGTNFNETAIERGSLTDIGQPFGGEPVDAETVEGALVPSDTPRGYRSRLDVRGDLSVQKTIPALVEYLDKRAVFYFARCCVARVNRKPGGLPVYAGAVPEGGVHAVVVFARDQLEWIARGKRAVAEARFARRRVAKRLGAELKFPVFGTETTICER